MQFRIRAISSKRKKGQTLNTEFINQLIHWGGQILGWGGLLYAIAGVVSYVPGWIDHNDNKMEGGMKRIMLGALFAAAGLVISTNSAFNLPTFG